MVHITSRVLRLIQCAETIVQSSGRNVITPLDLFVGALYERTGVLGELFLRGRFDMAMLKNAVLELGSQSNTIVLPPFQLTVSGDVFRVVQDADQLRCTYKQVLINEGHLFSALMKHSEVAQALRLSQSKMTQSDIESLVCSPRDMAVHLTGFELGDLQVGNVSIRRVKSRERDTLIRFVKTEFGNRWVDSVTNGFEQDAIPIFVAVDDEVLGFACFDVVGGKRGVFGPMGTRMDCRAKGIGRALLHRCLSEMQQVGYDYAVISNAGPIEFYERACGAVVIPYCN